MTLEKEKAIEPKVYPNMVETLLESQKVIMIELAAEIEAIIAELEGSL